MKRALLFVFIVFVALFSLTVARSQNAPEDLIPDVAAELNLWRLELGLGPLVYNPTLEAMAAYQADYLMSLADMPIGGDMHTDGLGQNARQRSQREPFAWPTYGHPELISVTEIAGVGSVRSSVAFWRSSNIHTRSVINPAYREIGVAVRDMNNRNGDRLIIVVMGGRPGVLPALPDPEVGDLYLTTEAAEWTGAWIGAPVRYRFLDEARQPISDWLDWAVIVPMPEEAGELFYVQYEDAAGEQAETEVRIPVVWSQFDLERADEVAAASTATGGSTPTVGGMIFATNTPLGTPAPTLTPSATPTRAASPTPTPVPAGVLLLYTSRLFTLIPTGNVDISDLSFRGGSLTFNVSLWADVSQGINLSALPAANCLQIWQRDAGDFLAPPACSYVRSVVFLAQDRLFWTSGSFDVLNNEQVVQTCETRAGQCAVTLP
ncbi:MAG: hypothetical protein HXY40_05185 [Chloroflexi bacterium]|nr:hypothetical protein [Chloroflexota bacterium]